MTPASTFTKIPKMGRQCACARMAPYIVGIHLLSLAEMEFLLILYLIFYICILTNEQT